MFQTQTLRHYPGLSISAAVDVLPTPHKYEGQHEEFDQLELDWLLCETLFIIQNHTLLASVGL